MNPNSYSINDAQINLRGNESRLNNNSALNMGIDSININY